MNAFIHDPEHCALVLLDSAGAVLASYSVVAFGKPVWYVTEVPGLGHEAAASLVELAVLFNRLLERLVASKLGAKSNVEKKNLTQYRAIP